MADLTVTDEEEKIDIKVPKNAKAATGFFLPTDAIKNSKTMLNKKMTEVMSFPELDL